MLAFLVAVLVALAGAGLYASANNAPDPDSSVKYYSNTGSGPGEMVVSEDIDAEWSMFYLEGYDFAGWNTAADGSGDMYYPGSILNGVDSLYAVWTEESGDPADRIYDFNAKEKLTQAVKSLSGTMSRAYTVTGNGETADAKSMSGSILMTEVPMTVLSSEAAAKSHLTNSIEMMKGSGMYKVTQISVAGIDLCYHVDLIIGGISTGAVLAQTGNVVFGIEDYTAKATQSELVSNAQAFLAALS